MIEKECLVLGQHTTLPRFTELTDLQHMPTLYITDVNWKAAAAGSPAFMVNSSRRSYGDQVGGCASHQASRLQLWIRFSQAYSMALW